MPETARAEDKWNCLRTVNSCCFQGMVLHMWHLGWFRDHTYALTETELTVRFKCVMLRTFDMWRIIKSQ